jgi:hypothetical protein
MGAFWPILVARRRRANVIGRTKAMSTGGLAILVIAALVALLACFGSEERGVVYENRTTDRVHLFVDGELVVSIEPGDESSVLTRKDDLPDRVQVRKADGDVLYDETETWGFLEKHHFRIVIE